MSSEPVRLRYAGTLATTFREPGVGHVEPDGEFDVDPGRLLSFMRRSDVEHAGECPWPPCRCALDPRPPASAAAESETAKHAKAKAGQAATD